MRLAILIRGIAYQENYVHHTGLVRNIDYRDNLQNIYDKIINPLKKKYSYVDLYIVSHESKLNNQVLTDFKPIRHILLDSSNNQNTCLRKFCFIQF